MTNTFPNFDQPENRVPDHTPLVENAKRYRIGFDTVAVVAHALTLIVYAATVPVDSNDDAFVSLVLLLIMEGLALFFHVTYILGFLGYAPEVAPVDGVNRIKWIEYGVTATCGSIAVLLSDGSTATRCETALIVSIAVMGGVQQAQGDLIEQFNKVVWHAFFTGAMLQVAEFAAVLIIVGAGWLTVQYLVFYALFGLLCLLSALEETSKGVLGNVVFVECLYSLLGWVTKVAIFWTFVVKETAKELSYVPPVVAVVALSIGTAVALKSVPR